MAAHAVTALAEMLYYSHTRPMGVWAELRAALDLSSWTEDLPFENYVALGRAAHDEDIFALFRAIAEAMVWACEEWARLEFPTTREEWHERKYQQAAS